MRFKNIMKSFWCWRGNHDRVFDDDCWVSYCKDCGKAWRYDLGGGMPSEVVGGEASFYGVVCELQKRLGRDVMVVWGEVEV